MDIYREIILDHYKSPRNFGHLPNPSVSTEAYNATCGDRIRMEITCQMRDDTCQIKEIRFSGEGCAISQASASMLTERVKGITADRVMKLSTRDILDMLGVALTPSRVKCAVLPLEVLQKALEKYGSRRVQ